MFLTLPSGVYLWLNWPHRECQVQLCNLGALLGFYPETNSAQCPCGKDGVEIGDKKVKNHARCSGDYDEKHALAKREPLQTPLGIPPMGTE